MVTKATGDIGALVKTNEAKMKYFEEVQTQKGTSYANLFGGLSISSDTDKLDYIKVKVITDYNQANLVIGEEN